jgi:hypothetical protein
MKEKKEGFDATRELHAAAENVVLTRYAGMNHRPTPAAVRMVFAMPGKDDALLKYRTERGTWMYYIRYDGPRD